MKNIIKNTIIAGAMIAGVSLYPLHADAELHETFHIIEVY